MRLSFSRAIEKVAGKLLPSEFSSRALFVYLFLWGESVSRAIWVVLNIGRNYLSVVSLFINSGRGKEAEKTGVAKKGKDYVRSWLYTSKLPGDCGDALRLPGVVCWGLLGPLFMAGEGGLS